MRLRFDDKVVLVTGGSSGIGAAVCRAFASGGAQVIVHCNSSVAGAESVVREVTSAGGRAWSIQADLLQRGAGAELVARAVERAGRLDVLVNNAGSQFRRSRIEDMPDDLFEQQLRLNFTSVFEASRAAIPHLRATRGNMVNISSVAARHGGGGGTVAYAAMKAAVSTFSRGLAKELAPEGVRVNVVAPGLIDTPFHEATPRELFERISEGIPLGRPGSAEECAGAVLFLASDDAASYVSGHSLEVNGAQYMP